MPSTLKKIGEKAFYQCGKLEELVIPDNVTSIGYQAFADCRSLKNVTFGKSLEAIGAYAFYQCMALEKITFGDSLKTIGGCAFKTCSVLNNVTIPSSVEEIDTEAFSYCIGLTDLYYMGTEEQWNKVTKGDGYLDYTNRDGTDYSLYHGATVTCVYDGQIGENVYYTFDETTGELNVVGTGATYNYYKKTGDRPFHSYKDSIKSITIGEGITKLDSYIFSDCTAIESLSLSSTVSSIEDFVLSNAKSLKTITVSDSNESFTVVDGVLFNKDKTTLVCYPTALGNTEYTVPNTVTLIGCSAFNYNTTLEKVIIQEGVTTIGPNAFYSSGIKEISLPVSLKYIQRYAFQSCNSLGDVYYGGSSSDWSKVAVANDNGKFNTTTSILHFVEKIQIGENVYYTFDEATGAVTITGTGETYDYSNDSPFKQNQNIKSVTVQEGVTGLGDWMFWGCNNITAVSFPESLESIGSMTFFNTKIDNIVIPDKVTSLERNSFSRTEGSYKSVSIGKGLTNFSLAYFGNISIESVTVSSENTNITVVDGLIFDKTKTQLLYYPCGLTKDDSNAEYTVPISVQRIADYAFAGNNFKKLTIPRSGLISRSGLLSRCSIDSLIIQSGTTIHDGSFSNCEIKTITLPSTITEISYYAFNNCRGLTDIYFMGTEDELKAITVYSGNESLNSTTIHYAYDGKLGDNVYYKLDETTGELSITGTGEMYDYTLFSGGKSPFYQNKSVKSVTIDEGVENIGQYLFASCSNLGRLTIPSTVKEIKDEAFYGCKLTTLVIPGTVETIGDSAFQSCEITNLTISDGVKTIKKLAFADNNFETVKIPKSVESFGDLSFYFCNKLQSITVDADNKDYASLAGVLFNKDMTKLMLYPRAKTAESYTVPESVKEIAASAFESNKNIKSVTMADNVETIGAAVFQNCTKLESVTLSNNLISIPRNTFYGCSALTSIVIPEGVTTIGNEAFYNCTSLKTVTIPSTLTSIGDNAFAYTLFYSATLRLDTVYYNACAGHKANFDAITFGTNNECIKDANVVYIVEHNFGEVQHKDVTCLEDGYDYKQCSICKLYYAADADKFSTDNKAAAYFKRDALGHTFTDVPYKAATCLEDGNEAYKYCTACNKYFDTTAEKFDINGADTNEAYIITATGHNFNDTVTGYDPDCCNNGMDSYKTCSNCNKFFEDVADEYSTDGKDGEEAFAIEALGHSFGDTVEFKSATCTEDGVKTAYKQCDRCKLYYDATAGNTVHYRQGTEHPSRFIENAHGHQFTDVPFTAAKCTEPGNEAYKYCTACELYFDTTAEEYDINGADDNSAYIITATGHEFAGAIKMDTDGKDGKHSFACVNGCDEYGNAVAHTWDNGTVTTPATHLNEGVKTYKCACGATYTEPVAKIADHTYTTKVVEPTCTEEGYTIYTCECGDNYVGDYVDATGHTYENGVCHCGAVEENNSNTTKCYHICHSKNKYVQHLWAVLVTILRIFNINHYCGCGAAHW